LRLVRRVSPKLGGIINMHSYSFPLPNWHPHVTNTVRVLSYSGIYNQLLEYNPETEDPFDLRSNLATSCELSKDGKVYNLPPKPKGQVARRQNGHRRGCRLLHGQHGGRAPAHLAWSPRRKIQGISSTLARRSEFSVGWAVPIKEDEIGVPSF
jgi:hypothetical protein